MADLRGGGGVNVNYFGVMWKGVNLAQMPSFSKNCKIFEPIFKLSNLVKRPTSSVILLNFSK